MVFWSAEGPEVFSLPDGTGASALNLKRLMPCRFGRLVLMGPALCSCSRTVEPEHREGDKIPQSIITEIYAACNNKKQTLAQSKS